MTFDNIALALAIACVVLRLAERPFASNLSASLAVLASTAGGWRARRRTYRAIELAEATAGRAVTRPRPGATGSPSASSPG